jgi:hypothetical protein
VEASRCEGKIEKNKPRRHKDTGKSRRKQRINRGGGETQRKGVKKAAFINLCASAVKKR